MSDANSVVIAVDIGGTNLRIALAKDGDPQTAILARRQASTVGVREPAKILDILRAGVADLLRETGRSHDNLESIAVGVPGLVNFDTGTVLVTSYLLGWRDVLFRATLEDAFQIPAAVDNDVNLAALGESRAGAGRDVANFCFISIGTGVGGGTIVDRKLVRGSNWVAGELGYMLLPGLPPDPAKRGTPGALESILGGEGIRSQWSAKWTSTLTPLPRDLQATDIFEAAQQGDPLASEILKIGGHALASVIYNISLVLNCPLFVIGGGVGTHPALSAAARSVLSSWGTRVSPELRVSELGTDAQLFGAIQLAREIRR